MNTGLSNASKRRRSKSVTFLMAGVLIMISGAHLKAQAPNPGAQPRGNAASEGGLPAAFANRELPSWIRFSGEIRTREEAKTSIGFKAGKDDTYTLTRFRLGVDLRPTAWFHAFVQGQDSHAFGIDPARADGSVKNFFDLREAYVDVGNAEKGWVRLRSGRQDLNFGAGRLLWSGDWGNVTRTYDGARLTVGPSGRSFDFMAVSPVVINPTRFDTHAAGKNLYAGYGTLTTLVPKATIEPYFFWKTMPGIKDKEGAVGHARILTTGGRWIGKLPAGFDYEVEMARQFGRSVKDDISSWAGDWTGGYSLPYTTWRPRFSAEYAYASGDSGKSGRTSTFDQVYGWPAHNMFTNADLFAWRNIRHVRGGVQLNPTRKATVSLDCHWLGLANAHDGLYNGPGVLVVKAPAGGALHTDVGHTADLYATYKLSPRVTLGAGYTHLFWGRFLKENAPKGSGNSYPYASISYKF